jgi:hypothetical protein
LLKLKFNNLIDFGKKILPSRVLLNTTQLADDLKHVLTNAEFGLVKEEPH